MQSIAIPVVLDVLSVEERRALLEDPAMATLQGVFAAVPDPRARRGLRYDLPFLLTCLVAALLGSVRNQNAQWPRACRSGTLPLNCRSAIRGNDGLPIL